MPAPRSCWRPVSARRESLRAKRSAGSGLVVSLGSFCCLSRRRARLHVLRRSARSARLRGGQIRTLAKNLSVGEQWISRSGTTSQRRAGGEAVPERPRPIEIFEFYVRAEARYDCVWTRACGIFPRSNTTATAPRAPQSAHPGRRPGFTGTLRNGDSRLASNVDRNNLPARLSQRATRELHEPCASTSCPGS